MVSSRRLLYFLTVFGGALFVTLICVSTGSAADYLKTLRDAALKGDLNAQLNLGQIYNPDIPAAERKVGTKTKSGKKGSYKDYQVFKQINVEQGYEEASKWYLMAANQGNAEAQSTLGYLWINGRLGGHARIAGEMRSDDCEKAAVWLTKSVAQGKLGDANLLAWMYERGCGVPQNDQIAYDLYFKAATGDIPRAQFVIGLIWENGLLGKHSNLLRAVEWYSRAFQAGEKDAGERFDVVKKRLTPDQSLELAQWEARGVENLRIQAAEQARVQVATETRAAETVAEDDNEPIPSTAAVIAGALGDIAGTIAQGRAQRAATSQQAAQAQTKAQRQESMEPEMCSGFLGKKYSPPCIDCNKNATSGSRVMEWDPVSRKCVNGG